MTEFDDLENTDGIPDDLRAELEAKVRDYYSARQPNTQPDNENRRTPQRWSDYERMRKTDPKLYWQPSTQRRMQKDYEALGRSFEDGGFVNEY